MAIDFDGSYHGQEDERKNEGYDVADEFTINWMNMKNGNTGEVLWQSESWGKEMWNNDIISDAKIPSDILKCDVVSREINFSSKSEICNLNLVQRILFNDTCIEEWLFDFGFVIPRSTNTWQQTIHARGKDKMIDPQVMSGNIIIDTSFYDGSQLVAKNFVRVYYIS